MIEDRILIPVSIFAIIELQVSSWSKMIIIFFIVKIFSGRDSIRERMWKSKIRGLVRIDEFRWFFY